MTSLPDELVDVGIVVVVVVVVGVVNVVGVVVVGAGSKPNRDHKYNFS